MKHFVFAILLFSASAHLLSEELVRVPSGDVKAIWLTPIGKNKDEKKVEFIPKIPVPGFWSMIKPVTRGQFLAFLKKEPQWNKELISRLFADETYLTPVGKNIHSPATNVSWFAARAYCAHNGMRLPTVNEWEYMAAASEALRDANQEEHFLSRILNWYVEPYSGAIKPVGSIYKNIYGVWDLHGLIWEWVEDFNSTFVTGESREDNSFNKGMFCGAGALSSADRENYAAYMRFAFRSGLKGKNTIWNLGFRCVKDEQ